MSHVLDCDWGKQWSYAVSKSIEHCSAWGAKTITLAAIKGNFSNYITLHEYPALLSRLQDGMVQGKIKADWDIIEERRIGFDRLDTLLLSAKGDFYVVIASCPNQLMAEVTKKVGSNRNVTLAWATANDLSSLASDDLTSDVSAGGTKASWAPTTPKAPKTPEVSQDQPPGLFDCCNDGCCNCVINHYFFIIPNTAKAYIAYSEPSYCGSDCGRCLCASCCGIMLPMVYNLRRAAFPEEDEIMSMVLPVCCPWPSMIQVVRQAERSHGMALVVPGMRTDVAKNPHPKTASAGVFGCCDKGLETFMMSFYCCMVCNTGLAYQAYGQPELCPEQCHCLLGSCCGAMYPLAIPLRARVFPDEGNWMKVCFPICCPYLSLVQIVQQAQADDTERKIDWF